MLDQDAWRTGAPLSRTKKSDAARRAYAEHCCTAGRRFKRINLEPKRTLSIIYTMGLANPSDAAFVASHIHVQLAFKTKDQGVAMSSKPVDLAWPEKDIPVVWGVETEIERGATHHVDRRLITQVDRWVVFVLMSGHPELQSWSLVRDVTLAQHRKLLQAVPH